MSPAQLGTAATVLARTSVAGQPLAVDTDAEQPNVLALTVSADAGELNPALRALIEAGVDVLGLDVEAPRLSDAFLQLTGGLPAAATAAVPR